MKNSILIFLYTLILSCCIISRFALSMDKKAVCLFKEKDNLLICDCEVIKIKEQPKLAYLCKSKSGKWDRIDIEGWKVMDFVGFECFYNDSKAIIRNNCIKLKSDHFSMFACKDKEMNWLVFNPENDKWKILDKDDNRCKSSDNDLHQVLLRGETIE